MSGKTCRTPAEKGMAKAPAKSKAKGAGKEAAPVQNEKAEQAALNIGMVGHVDHGKCIAADELVLLNNEIIEAGELANRLQQTASQTKISESELLFTAPQLRAFSLAPDFSPVSALANVFVQEYSGPFIQIETKRGKKIRTSPKHPLLIHDGLELEWKEARAIRAGDCIVALRTIPDQCFVKDYGNDWEEKLAKDFWIAGYNDFGILRQKTKNFTEFDEITVKDWNCLRILQRLSTHELEKKLGINRGELAANMRRGRLTNRQIILLQKFFAAQEWPEPKRKILNLKSKSHCFCEIDTANDPFGAELLRLLAFIMAEGHVDEKKLQIAQSQNNLLEEAKQTLSKNFGVSFRHNRGFDYYISNVALVQYLKARYGIKTGAARNSGIPAWVFSLPKEKLAQFLNMFFSAEANANKKSSQITLVQANGKNIEIISYCLKKFSISHSVHKTMKAATNGKNIKRAYYQLIISGTENLERFRNAVGFSLQEKQTALEAMAKKQKQGKQSDEMVPLKKQIMIELAGLLGWKKHCLTPRQEVLRGQQWFWAYNDCYAKNAISPKNLETFLRACKKRLGELGMLEKRISGNMTKEVLSELGSSWQWLSGKMGITPKILFRLRKNANKEEQSRIQKILQDELKSRLDRASEIIRKIETGYSPAIEFDFAKTIRTENYTGQIIDLQVPGYHNFAAGCGALICHNTSLTQALTGKWTDTHSEELKRGISIRLGYADVTMYKCSHCSGPEAYTTKPVCPVCGKKTEKLRQVSFVDAPGHETLMTTMLSGAALMNGAILVIAANEFCPQPQTEEHLMALKMVGIEHIVVAQNKIDLVEPEKARENMMQIKDFLEKNNAKDVPIIPIAANFSGNIDLLIKTVHEKIPTPKFDLEKPLLMYCARSFDVNKPGSKICELKGGVLGGTIIQGKAIVGENILVRPGIDEKEILTGIRSLSCSSGRLDRAVPGGLVAIGTGLDSSLTQNDRLRGQVIGTKESLPEATKELDIEINYIKRVVEKTEGKISSNEPIVLTIGTMAAVGTVAGMQGGRAKILLKNSVVVLPGQKIAISKKASGRWQLVAYAVAE